MQGPIEIVETAYRETMNAETWAPRMLDVMKSMLDDGDGRGVAAGP